VEPAVDLKCENIPAPAALDRSRGVPEPQIGSVEFLQQGEMVVPGQLCKRRLHNC
jgi:hypothetical protein